MSTQSTQKHPYRSARLTFRALEEEDKDFFHEIASDAIGFDNSELALKKPQGKKDTKKAFEYISETCLLGLVVCVTEAQGADPALKPIGVINLTSLSKELAHHQYAELGLSLLPAYQGKGYGTEAIEWAVNWAFESANLHRVAINAFEYNYGARKLYERMGFKHEGTIREKFFHNGRWWDDYEYGILASEWKERRKAG